MQKKVFTITNSHIFIYMENIKLIELHFGTGFNQKWLDYIQFMEDRGQDISIQAQNSALSRIDDKTEKEAIDTIEKCKIIVDRVLYKRLL